MSSSPQTTLDQLAAANLERFKLPGLSLALWQDDQLYQSACGKANLVTGVEATTDTVFQIGSITKVMTTCLVMQLVDEGRVELDAPVRHYLHDFLVADAEASANITVRQLLNHSSGMAGDFFPDDNGHQGNLIARYIDRCNLLPQVNPPGAVYSYSNSAFVTAGRLVEVVRGISWYQAMEEYIFKPLGMDHAIADPKNLIRFRAAMGHLQNSEADGGWELSDTPWLALGMAPCGSTPTMSTADLITFARAHLNGGNNTQGQQWLSPESVAAMQQPQIAMPQTSPSLQSHAGLGWRLSHYTESGLKSFGHAGATHGFYSYLIAIPEHNAIFALLMNGVHPDALVAIQADLLELVSGVRVKEDDVNRNIALTAEHQCYPGHYESMDKRIDVWIEQDTLRARMAYKIDPLPTEELILYPQAGQSVAAFKADGSRRPNLAFVGGSATEPPGYFFDGSRLNPRT